MINNIVIKDLEIECIIGIHPWERDTLQKISIDLKAFFDFSAVNQSRSIKDTVDYVKVTEVVVRVAKAGKYRLLESMAQDIAAALFEEFPITTLEFHFRKPTPDVPNARYVGIDFRIGRNKPILPRSEISLSSGFSAGNLHKNRVALITGSAKGLGMAFAKHLGQLGCKIAVHYRRSKKEAEGLVSEMSGHGISARAFQGELASASSMQDLARAVTQQMGGIDYLINNVGAYSSKPLTETTPEEFSEIIQTNICGTFFLTQEVLKHMRAKRFGRIINIGGAAAERIRAYKNETPYQISKTGVLILTKSIASTEAANGITCNMISPGIMVNNTYSPPGIYDSIPMGRLGQFSDFFGALDYLLSPAADYVTGTAIEVTGGYGL